MYLQNLSDTQNPFELSDEYYRKIFRLAKIVAINIIEKAVPHTVQESVDELVTLKINQNQMQ